ncbi:MAG: hypothetical protein ABSE73_21125 [Planctomycetota bacterium]
MNTTLEFRCPRRGAVLLLAVIVLTALAILSTAMMRLAVSDTTVTNASEDRQEALNMAKAGLAMAMAELAAGKDLDGDGYIGAIGSKDDPLHPGNLIEGTPHTWGDQHAFYVLKTPEGASTSYTLDAYGIVNRMLVGNSTQVSRHIQVMVAMQNGNPSGGFPGGAFGKKSLTIDGNSTTDSWNSNGIPVVDPTTHVQLTNADGSLKYTPATYAQQAAQANFHNMLYPWLGGTSGNVGSNGTITINGASGDVWGNANYGPAPPPYDPVTGGTPTISGHLPVIQGASTALTAPVTLPDPTPLTTPPASLGAAVALPSTVGTAGQSTTIRVNGISGSVTINGNVTMYLAGSMTLHGQSLITVTANSSLTVLQEPGTYTVDISGSNGGVSNLTNIPNNFQFISAATGSESWLGNADWMGTIYAPNAPVTLGGNGQIYGAFVGGALTLHGTPSFHRDQNASSPIFASQPYPVLEWWTEVFANY